MTRTHGVLVGRDQDATPFSGILLRLCDATSALGAALVDHSGETVDYAGSIEPFRIRVAAAEMRLLLDLLSRTEVPSFRETQELIMRGSRMSCLAAPLTEGYAIVIILPRRGFGASPRALAEAVREVCREAGLEEPPRRDTERWVRVEVKTRQKSRGRPEALWHEGRWCKLEILGRFTQDSLNSREIGYRARLHNGADVTIVREPLGIWYAYDLPDV